MSCGKVKYDSRYRKMTWEEADSISDRMGFDILSDQSIFGQRPERIRMAATKISGQGALQADGTGSTKVLE